MKPGGLACRRRGFALVAVLWLVAALSVLVAGMSMSLRVDLALAHSDRQLAAGAALGDGAIALAVAGLLARDDRPQELLRRRYQVDGNTVEVEIVPVTGLVDLSGASPLLLERLLVDAGGLTEAIAGSAIRRLLARQEMWKDDPDALYHTLLNDPAIDASLHDTLSRLITFHPAGVEGINPRAAPHEVLLLLAGNDAARQDSTPDLAAWAPQLITTEITSVYRIEARVAADRGSYVVRTRWIDIGQRSHSGLPWATLRVEPARLIKVADDVGA